MYASYRIRQIQGPVTLFGKLFSVNQLCIALNIAGIPILYLFGAGNIMFWVVGKFSSAKWHNLNNNNNLNNNLWMYVFISGASTLVAALHASFYNIDAIVTEEFESFLTETETV